MTITFSGITISGGGVTLVAPPAPPPTGDTYWGNVVFLLNTTSSGSANNKVFLDSSVNSQAITNFTNTTQGSYSPYPVSPNTSSYSTAVNGGSALFDAAGSTYLSVADNASLRLGTSDFTIETWINPTSPTGAKRGIAGKGATLPSGWDIYLDTNRVLYYTMTSNAISSGSTIAGNTWTHIAVSRTANVSSIYVNGNLAKSFPDTQNYTQTHNLLLGTDRGSNYFMGYFSDFHIVKGTGLYTANFSVPTGPISATANTVLLMHMTNAGTYDAAAVIDANTVTNMAVVSSAQAKFGTTSLSFNGTNQLFGVPPSADFGGNILTSKLRLGTANFTIEGWIYDSKGSGANRVIFNTASNNFNGCRLLLNSTNNVAFTANSSTFTSSSNTLVTANTWNHFALSRAGNNANLYINGNLAVTGNVSSLNLDTTKFDLGTFNAGNYWGGYMDQVRITNGIARYTANFTVPAAAFPTSA